MLVLKHSTRFVFPCHHGELGMPGFHPSGDQEAEAMEEKQAGDKWDETGSPPPTALAYISGRNAKACVERAPSHTRNRFSSSYVSRDSKKQPHRSLVNLASLKAGKAKWRK